MNFHLSKKVFIPAGGIKYRVELKEGTDFATKLITFHCSKNHGQSENSACTLTHCSFLS